MGGAQSARGGPAAACLTLKGVLSDGKVVRAPQSRQVVAEHARAQLSGEGEGVVLEVLAAVGRAQRAAVVRQLLHSAALASIRELVWCGLARGDI